MSRLLLIAGGPSLALAIGLAPIPGLETAGRLTLSITAWMAFWWITEAVPISVTALLPLAAFPFAGVLDARQVSASYGNEAIYLFLGGMLLAQSMERSGLHRRIALTVIRFTGSTGRGLVLGFMIATATVSMWVSNTATTVMVLPVALATLATLMPGDDAGEVLTRARVEQVRFAKALLLGIAYAANIGGMGTLVGTAPNLVFAGMVNRLYPEASPITFFDWMKVGLPMVVLFVPIAWFALTRWIWRWDEKKLGLDGSTVDDEIRALGPMRREEKWTMGIFFTTAFLWIFRADLELGVFTLPGWSRLFGEPAFLRDSTVAIAAAIALFVIPMSLRERRFLLAADWYRRVPWDVLILLGGGFALATAFQESGLSAWLADRLGGLGTVPLVLLVLLVAGAISFFTEVASNTATTTVMLPILGASAVAFGIHPFVLMVPCTLAASCAFMLPAATPPNAIVFSSGHLHVRDMARTGILIDVIGVLLVLGLAFTVIPWALGMSPGVQPPWAR